MEGHDRARAPRRHLGRKLLLALASFAVFASLAEGLNRLRLRCAGARFDPAAVQRRILADVDAMRSPVPAAGAFADSKINANQARPHVLHPYYGFDMGAKVEGLAAQVARAGRARGELVVMILGGSVAAMTAKYGAAHLSACLQDEPRLAGRELLVVNHARGSFKQPQQAMVLGHLLSLGLDPDVVINIDGFNEVALSAHNAVLGAHPTYPHLPRWAFVAEGGARDEQSMELALVVLARRKQAEAYAQRVLESGAYRISLLSHRIRSTVAGYRRAWIEAQDAYVDHFVADDNALLTRGPPYPPGLDEALGIAVRCWFESSVTLDAMCDARGIVYLHVLQPTLHDEGSKPLTPTEIERGESLAVMVAGTREGYLRMREASRAFESRGVEFLDASRCFADVRTTLYADACHYEPEGTRGLVDAIAARLRQILPDSAESVSATDGR